MTETEEKYLALKVENRDLRGQIEKLELRILKLNLEPADVSPTRLQMVELIEKLRDEIIERFPHPQDLGENR